MINLIPNEKKKKGVREFYFRFFVVFFFVLGFLVLISFIVFLPSYFISSVKKNFTDNQLTVQKAEPILEVDQKVFSQISDMNRKLALVESIQKNKYIISTKVINEVVFKKTSNIKINQISYKNNPTSGKIINVRGTAESREQLLLFRRAFENDVGFKKVDLPISNFVKGSDISFSLSLTPL